MNKIVGIKHVDYVSKKTNRPVTGITFFLLCEQPGVEGLASDSIFVSSVAACYPEAELFKLGDYIKVFYNRYGNVEGVQLDASAPASGSAPETAKK